MSLEQKKLAIIKSNASPEIKLQALKKLNASDPSVEKAKQELTKLLQLVGLRASVALLKEETDLRSLEQYANLVVKMLEKMKSPKIEKVRGELRQLGVYRNSLKDNEDNLKKNWVKIKEFQMNAIEQKKLAVIKSNAAPEVKLKALEKLNATKDNGWYVRDEASDLQIKILLDYVNQALKLSRLAAPAEKSAAATANFLGFIDNMTFLKRELEEKLKQKSLKK